MPFGPPSTDEHSDKEHCEGGVNKLIYGGIGEVETAGEKGGSTVIRSYSSCSQSEQIQYPGCAKNFNSVFTLN